MCVASGLTYASHRRFKSTCVSSYPRLGYAFLLLDPHIIFPWDNFLYCLVITDNANLFPTHHCTCLCWRQRDGQRVVCHVIAAVMSMHLLKLMP